MEICIADTVLCSVTITTQPETYTHATERYCIPKRLSNRDCGSKKPLKGSDDYSTVLVDSKERSMTGRPIVASDVPLQTTGSQACKEKVQS